MDNGERTDWAKWVGWVEGGKKKKKRNWDNCNRIKNNNKKIKGRPANFFYKGLDGKYFRLSGPHTVPATYSLFCFFNPWFKAIQNGPWPDLAHKA